MSSFGCCVFWPMSVRTPKPNETTEQRKASLVGFGKARDNVIAQVQTILKHEWERVKKGDV